MNYNGSNATTLNLYNVMATLRRMYQRTRAYQGLGVGDTLRINAETFGQEATISASRLAQRA